MFHSHLRSSGYRQGIILSKNERAAGDRPLFQSPLILTPFMDLLRPLLSRDPFADLPFCRHTPAFFLSCRCHVVDEFNRGIYDYIIATDEVLELPSQVAGKGRGKGNHKKKKKDKEYGVARGIDFQGEAMCTIPVALLRG